MRPTVVINVVGLTRELLRHMPALASFAGDARVATIGHVTPAVTCSVQATYLTGMPPSEHGVVGNGWYDREDCEVKFWKQSNGLVQQPRIWDIARRRDASFTCANLFWWHAMYSSADVTVTPRPMYPADGRKVPDVWTDPPTLRDELQQRFGQFPLFKFWGPAAGIESSAWIARAGEFVAEKFSPTLMLVYLPHLDYCLQRRGPDPKINAMELAEIDAELSRLINRFTRDGRRIIVLSEYGIEPVSRPIHINRVLRQHGLLAIRDEAGRDTLDAGASRAFAVADHQVAHVYVNDKSAVDEVERIVRSTAGVDQVLSGESRKSAGVDHERAGDIVAIAEAGAWFTYYFWEDDARAPDYARTVDIHRKPGYDPVELFFDPAKSMVRGQIAWKLAKRKLGFRSLLDVIPLDATLVKGSHGRPPASADAAPVFISRDKLVLADEQIAATDVCSNILRHVFD